VAQGDIYNPDRHRERQRRNPGGDRDEENGEGKKEVLN
jgi:hypothetical protein